MTEFLINDEQRPGGAPLPRAHLSGPVEWTAQPKQSDDPVQQAYNDIKAANDALGAFVDTLDTQGRNLTPESRTQAIDGFANTQAAGLVDQGVARMNAHVAQAQADYDATLAALTPPGDAAAELRNERTLQRAERTLSQIRTGEAVPTVQKLIGDADPEARAILLRKLPELLADRGIPAEVAASAANAIPELAEKDATLRAVAKQRDVINYDAMRAREAIKRGSPAVALVDPTAGRQPGSRVGV
jgi:hypothetical protein